MDESASGPPPAAAEEPPRRLAPFLALGIGAVFAVLLVLLATASGQKNAESATTHLMGRTAPNIVGPTLGGGEFDLSAWRGRWMVLNFFTSTCVPCVQEHPELTAFASRQSGLMLEKICLCLTCPAMMARVTPSALNVSMSLESSPRESQYTAAAPLDSISGKVSSLMAATTTS